MPRVPPGELAAQLRRELDQVGEIDRLTVGPNCDVYPGPEAELGINWRALEVLDERTCSPGPAISSGSR